MIIAMHIAIFIALLCKRHRNFSVKYIPVPDVPLTIRERIDPPSRRIERWD
jgi:hypothetical protein